MRIPRRARNAWLTLSKAFSEWSNDQAPMQSAALAYYTVFSIAPVLIISIAVAGFVFGEQAARGQVFEALRGILGPEGAHGVGMLLRGARAHHASSILATALGIATLLLGASGVFLQLQQSLDLIWKVQPRRDQGIWAMVRQRLFSFSVVLAIGFLLLVSLVISAALAAAGRLASERLPGGQVIWHWVDFGITFVVVAGLFAAIFKILPDVQLRWRDTWQGAVITALLFGAGKVAIGTYLGKSAFASAYGAAASIMILLLWVYYSSCILYFGAELTRVLHTGRGRAVVPKSWAERVALLGVQGRNASEICDETPRKGDAA